MWNSPRTGLVEAFLGTCAEVVPLGLQQVRGETAEEGAVVTIEGSAEDRIELYSGLDDSSPTQLSLFDHLI